MDVEIEKLIKGDRPTWDRAYQILFAISLGVCCTTGSSLNHQEQEDFAGEAITEVIEYIEKVDSFAECERLVGSIARNKLLDHFKKLASQKHGENKVDSLELHEGFDTSDPTQQQADVATMNGETALLLTEALNKVPPKYRAVVSDHYLHGLTHQEIADKHGLKVKSIGVYMDRGLKALRRVLPKDLQ